jgi:hypothetical protein
VVLGFCISCGTDVIRIDEMYLDLMRLNLLKLQCYLYLMWFWNGTSENGLKSENEPKFEHGLKFENGQNLKLVEF